MGRIHKLTKLILVSTKNTISTNVLDIPTHQHRHSFGEEEKMDAVLESPAACLENETSLNHATSTLPLDLETDIRTGIPKSLSKSVNDQLPYIGSLADNTQAGELFSRTLHGRKPPPTGTTMVDQMDLLMEQVHNESFNRGNVLQYRIADPKSSPIIDRKQKYIEKGENKGSNWEFEWQFLCTNPSIQRTERHFQKLVSKLLLFLLQFSITQ